VVAAPLNDLIQKRTFGHQTPKLIVVPGSSLLLGELRS
jgi:hypothetical protein